MAAVLAALLAADLAVILTFPASVPSSDATLLSSLAIWIPLSLITAIGVLLALRRPRNPTGWLLGSFALLFGLSGLSSDYVFHWLYGHDLPRAFVTPLGLTAPLSAQLQFVGVGILLLVFPDGRLLSRRWRIFVWLNLVVGLCSAIPILLDPGAVGDGHRQLSNPLGVAGAHSAVNAIGNAARAATFALAAVGLVSLVIRYRRADSDLHEQVKWFGLGASVLLAAVIVGVSTSPTSSTWTTPIPVTAEVIGFSALPLCIGVAVLKYRLYDIDIVINRTLVYGSLAVFITAVYVGIAVGVGALVGRGGKPNLGLSILATAIVAVGFQPVRQRLQRVANRLVYGKRATPYEVLSEFSERVAESYAGDDVLPRMARVLAQGTGAQRADVWLRSGESLRAAAAWPADATLPDPVPLNGAGVPTVIGTDRMVLVRHQESLLGALSVAKRTGESLTPVEEDLLTQLANQAGLVLKNVGLTADLQTRLEELRISRQRMVTAQDEERRRLERNLHDGAQQSLVALKVKLGLTEMLMVKNPEQAKAIIGDLKADADEALETLRDLARGIYPPLLADKGLAAALDSQARKATVPVTVDTAGIGRYPQEFEAAVYFCVLEALQNVQKYAHASHVIVSVREANGTVSFGVDDDGCGFDLTTAKMGSGLTNMADRLEALGGHIKVMSAPGRGTRLGGSFQIDASDADT